MSIISSHNDYDDQFEVVDEDKALQTECNELWLENHRERQFQNQIEEAKKLPMFKKQSS